MLSPPKAGVDRQTWQYGRRADGIETAIWSGRSSVPLGWHFHREVQLTTVLTGQRRFLVAETPLTVNAGETLIMPARLPHRPLGLQASPARSLNFYLDEKTDRCCRTAIVLRTPAWLGPGHDFDSGRLGDWVRQALPAGRNDGEKPASDAVARLISADRADIAEVAFHCGMSREGFTRWFRRHVGMTPHAYRLAARLNRARAQLAAGAAPADAAAATGFADQSHMGRRFRCAFGVTPAAYRHAVAG